MKKIISLIAISAAITISSFAIPARPAQAASACVQNYYRQGSSGSCVSYIQQLANWQVKVLSSNPSAPIAADGAFGSRTRSKVIEVQRLYALSQDGVVGPQTWRSLCDARRAATAGFPQQAFQNAGCYQFYEAPINH